MKFSITRRHARLWVFATVLMIAGVVIGIVGNRVLAQRRFRGEFDRARMEMNAGSFTAAGERLSRLSLERPDDNEVVYRLGLCEAQRGNAAKALDAWSQLDSESPWLGPAAVPAANAAIALGRLTAAEAILKRALERPRPETAAIAHMAAILLVQQGRTREAARLMEAAWDNIPGAMPGSREIRLALLRDHVGLDFEAFPLELNMGMLQDSLPPSRPDDRQAMALARAHMATEAGDFAGAEAILNFALQEWPTNAGLWKSRLDWAIAAGQPDAALRTFDVLRPAQLDREDQYRVQALLAREQHEVKSEMHALQTLVEVNPGSSQAISRLAELMLESGDRHAAIELRQRKVQLDADRDRYQQLYKENRFPEHLADLETLAGRLGRTFEAVGFRELRAQTSSSHIAKTLSPKSRSLNADSGRAVATIIRDPAESTDASPLGSWRDLRPSPRASSSRGAVLQFENKSESSGLAMFVQSNGVSDKHQLPEMACGGVGLIDYNGDGRLDVYCVQGGPFPPSMGNPGSADRLFRNRGDGTFQDVSQSTRIDRMPGGYGHGIAVADYDNDGHPDIFVTRWRSYALYRNRGDGTFEDRTSVSGLDGDRDWPTSAAFADLDNDGDLDLYVCHYGRWDALNPKICNDPSGARVLACDPRTIEALPDHLFRNDGGRFVDVTAQAGIVDRDGRGLGVVAADLDQDGLVDIFVANDTTANFLFRNRGNLRFEEVGHEAGVAANAAGGYQAGMGVACGDVDRDGRFDLAVTNFYGESTTLFVNLGQGFFADRTAAAGLLAATRHRLGFGVALFDVNNDGWLDLMTVNGHVSDQRPLFPYAMTPQLFLGSSSGTFLDVTAEAGGPFQEPVVGRALAVGDLDDDGRLDAIIMAQNQPLIYAHGPSTTQASGHFLRLRLVGAKSNRDGIGAVVKLTAGDQNFVAQRFGGGSYQSAADPRLHFGLGAITRIETLEVRWPSGVIDRYRDLPVDQGLTLYEGAKVPGQRH